MTTFHRFPSPVSLLSLALFFLLPLGVTRAQIKQIARFTGATGALPGDLPFATMSNDGAGNLWGTTNGDSGNGTMGSIYRVNASTRVATHVAAFTGTSGVLPGASPYGAMASDGAGSLWGTTSAGGAANNGTIYRVNTSTGVVTTVLELSSAVGEPTGPVGGLVNDGAGFFWGTTGGGGTNDLGTVFNIQISNGALTKVVDFTGTNGVAKGSAPFCSLVSDGSGFFWGTTASGGSSNFGTVFKVNASSGVLTTVVEFTGTSGLSKGMLPTAGLVSAGGKFWGTTSGGGAGLGTVFSVDPATGILTTVVEFSGSTGSNKGSSPRSELTSDGAGMLFGTTSGGGRFNVGTVYKVNVATAKLTTLAEFTGFVGANPGNAPIAGLERDDAGAFWGTTSGSGGFIPASIFKLSAISYPVVPPPVLDTTTMVPGEAATFVEFGLPSIDGGQVGGRAAIKAPRERKQTVIYASDGSVLVRTGGLDPEGAEFTDLGDPVFAGEAFGFAGTARQTASSTLPLRLDTRLGFGFDERAYAVKPGGRLAALYSQLSKAAGLHRLAAQADPAPGVPGGQFAKFPGFGLPRDRGGLIFTGALHRADAVSRANDFGVWRERVLGSGSDLLLRHGNAVSGTDARTIKKLSLLTPVANSTDQRRSFAPDGGVGAHVEFAEGGSGVVRVQADGSVDVPIDESSPVPDTAGAVNPAIRYRSFTPPATASQGLFAFLATLERLPAPTLREDTAVTPRANVGIPGMEGIFSNVDGNMKAVFQNGATAPGQSATIGHLGQPALGAKGAIGTLAKLVGPGVRAANNTALLLADGAARVTVARKGDAAPDAGEGAVFQRFLSMVVTDSDPARLVFTAKISGPGVRGSNNVGLWSARSTGTPTLLLRLGGPVEIGNKTLTVRSFQALVAPPGSIGQGRSTDASGFVTAKVKLSDGRSGVLRIPLP